MYKYYEILGIKTRNFLKELSNNNLQLIPFSKINDPKCLEESLQVFINLEAYKNVYNKHKILHNFGDYLSPIKSFKPKFDLKREEYNGSPICPLLLLFNIYGSVINYGVLQLVEKDRMGFIMINMKKKICIYITADECKSL